MAHSSQRREWVAGLLFASPFVVGFALFTVYPICASLFYSFCDYTVFEPPRWNGGANYVELVTDDPLFWKALSNTAVFTVFSVPLVMVVGLLLALLLNLKVRGQAFFRTLFFLPSIVPIVASAVLWVWVLNPQYGLVNTVLQYLGIPAPGWLADPDWAKPALILMSVWGAGHNMVLYLAGLQDVPRELHEAAEIDGAGAWQKTWYITLPIISPVLFFTLVMGMIGSFQYFTSAWVMSGNGPDDSTLFYALYLFNNAFLYFRMGYASAMAWLLFLVILGATLLIFRFSQGRVHYEATN